MNDDGLMYRHRRSLRLVALVVVVALPLLGISGVASAKATKDCHKAHSCKSGGSSPTGSGTGADPAPMTVQVDPNPLVETGGSDVLTVVQVETSPSFAGDTVTVHSSQLSSSCDAIYLSLANPGGFQDNFGSIKLTLDDDGNATTTMFGESCAPGQNVIEADLDVAPYLTALTTLVLEPPVVSTPGLYGYPTTSGTVTGGEVETGDSAFPGSSDVYAVFVIEADPVYAEQTVAISSPQLVDRCDGGTSVFPVNGFESFTSDTNTAVLDNDGNAVFFFIGASCAAGSSVVTADVQAGSHPTYTTTFTILPPQPTI